MHTKTLKKLALALTFWLALHTAPLRAQLLGPYTGTSPIEFEIDSNGLLFDIGSHGTGSLSLSGAGTRMIWYPGKAAFRAWNVGGTEWNDTNIGNYSVALGKSTVASGGTSMAVGDQTTASGYAALALVNESIASGSRAAAIGWYATASGIGAMSLGTQTLASGTASVATGEYTTASGNYASALGYYTTTASYDAVAFGTYNLDLTETGGTPNSTTWESVDPLFEVGNGTSGTHSDALVIFKDGTAAFSGAVTAPPGSDIPMYTGD